MESHLYWLNFQVVKVKFSQLNVKFPSLQMGHLHPRPCLRLSTHINPPPPNTHHLQQRHHQAQPQKSTGSNHLQPPHATKSIYTSHNHRCPTLHPPPSVSLVKSPRVPSKHSSSFRSSQPRRNGCRHRKFTMSTLPWCLAS